MFYNYQYFYYITIGLQAICAIHSVRRGTQGKWLWIIIFLPVVGSLIYIFTEMFTSRDVQKMQWGVGSFINPSGRVKRLESNLQFSETFANKIALADAYLDSKQTEKAIALYESCLIDNFAEHEYASMKLMYAYSEVHHYEAIVVIGKQIYNLPQFKRSRAHTIYAIALSKTGNEQEAEKEFRLLNTRFSNYESRFRFGEFLIRTNRADEAKKIFREILNESSHLSSYEKRNNNTWFALARKELKNV